MTRGTLFILVAYLVLLVTLTGALWSARTRVLAHPDTALSRESWEEWRREAARQSEGEGPVARRPPSASATEAPTVLLLRDHFAACLTLALVISTVLFATLALMIRGVLSGPKLDFQHDAPPPGRS